MFNNNNLAKKDKIFMLIRAVVLLFAILLMAYITIKCIPLMSKLLNEDTRVEFKNEIEAMGIKGVLIVLGLQVLQIVVAVLPGQPMEIVSGMLYGTIGGTILCLVGILIGTVIVYFLVRKIGKDFMLLFFSQEKIDSIQNSKIFKNPAKFEILMFIAFLLPFLPKDIFIYLGGLSPVKPKRFLLISTIPRIPGLLISAYAGNKISEGRFFRTIIIFSIFLIVGFIGYEWSNRKRRKMEEEEEKKETLENDIKEDISQKDC